MRRAALAALTLAATAGIPAGSPGTAARAQGMSGTAAGPVAITAAPAPAGTGVSGGLLTTTLSQSLVADSNYNLDDPSPGTTYYGDSRVALDYLRQTRTQSLAFGLDTGLRALDEAGQSFEFVLASPSTANIDFSVEGADTSFDAGARIRSRRVDYLGELDIDGPIPDDITSFQEEQNSVEYRSDADLGFTLGTNSPSTWDFNVAATNFDYNEDTGRNNLVPRRSVQTDGTWTLQITPVFATVAALGYYWYSADNATDEEITVAEGDVGVAYTPTENLRVRGGLGYADRRQDETIGGIRDTTEHDQGIVVRGDFRYVQPSFTLLGDARWTTAAPTDRLSGVIRGVYNLPRGEITGRVFQRYGGGQGGSDSRLTGAGLGITHELTQVSSLAFDASYATQVDEEGEDPDIDRTDLTASYIHNLTETVSAQVGYGFRNRVEDPDNATSNRVFLVIGKTFETGL